MNRILVTSYKVYYETLILNEKESQTLDIAKCIFLDHN
jgi:hypothetical protein